MTAVLITAIYLACVLPLCIGLGFVLRIRSAEHPLAPDIAAEAAGDTRWSGRAPS